jgi:glycerol-3-phosphate acyltransferase PlsY
MSGLSASSLLEGIEALNLVLLSIGLYLYGAVPFAYLATYVLAHKEITESGTGNAGVMNAFRVGGTPAGIITIAGEVSKGVLPILVAELLLPGQLYPKLLFALAAFVGTNFSIFLGGGGGRGSTLLMWSMALLSYRVFLPLIVISGLLFAFCREDDRLRHLWSWLLPVVILLVERDWGFVGFGVVVALLIFVKGRHSVDDYVYYGYVRQSQDE